MDGRARTKGPFGRLDATLARLGTIGATAVLTCVAVLAALGALLLVAMFGGPPVTLSTASVACFVTVVVAAPIVLYSQRLIRKLRDSRGALKEMTSRLALAVDQADQASRAKSTFLANMSHELRTPLNAIIGFSEVIRDQHMGPVGSPRYLAYAGDIHASGQHLLNIINDILDLSKIEAGKMSIDSAAEFDLAGAIEASVRIVRPLAEREGVSLGMDDPRVDIRLIAAERMVCQILINLLTNAVKFTPPGGRVWLTGTLRSDGSFELSVRDTGVGMTKDGIMCAITPFGQIDNAITRKHAGTGLGLPLSKAMMELHEGKMHIQSTPQQGTVVSLIFPTHRVITSGAQLPEARQGARR